MVFEIIVSIKKNEVMKQQLFSYSLFIQAEKQPRLSLGGRVIPDDILAKLGSFLSNYDCINAGRICKDTVGLRPILRGIKDVTIGR